MRRSIFLILVILSLASCANEAAVNNYDRVLPASQVEFTENRGNFFGEIYVEGFVSVEHKKEAFCEVDQCNYYDYLWLNISKTSSEAILDYIRANSGNSFYSYDDYPMIGLGCLEGDNLHYLTSADSFGQQEEFVKGGILNELLDSSPSSRIRLKLQKEKLSSGRGAPSCYSHINSWEIL